MTGFRAQQALQLIDDVLIRELGFQRIDKSDRTKAQFFEVTPKGRQFALVVGDQDSDGLFKPKQARLVLEELPPAGLPDVELLPASDVLNGGHLNNLKSRLRPPGQRSVLVASEHGLRNVLQWYVGSKPLPTLAALDSVSHPREKAPNRQSMHQPMNATNTILYGPPGTGKTFLTARRAVELCDGGLPGEASKEEVRARYEELRLEGRITFVTFHQSYGYEEFVEGLRPQLNAAGQVSYGVEPGAFRRACDSARLRTLLSPGLTGKPLRERTVFKMSLGASSTNEGAVVFKFCLDNQRVLLGWGEDLDFTDCSDEAAIRDRILKDAPTIEKLDSQARYVNYFKHELKVGDVIVVSHGNRAFRGIAEVTGEYEYVDDGPLRFHQARPVKWLAVFEAGRPVSEINAKDFTMSSLYKLSSGAINYAALDALLAAQSSADEVKPHVLIIDEINRANISKVFGELITLLEPDKREGAPNAIVLKLPYSRVDFSVPANLHVLGTMNTADRSIALLDTALRRRFDFEELMPDATALNGREIEGIDLSKMLAALNERVEALYDRDHTIGHAFFMNVTTLDELRQVFRRKVLPLLQEYFYENWSNVRRVLNDLSEGDFVKRKTAATVAADGGASNEDEPRQVFTVNQTAFPVAAFKRIYAAA